MYKLKVFMVTIFMSIVVPGCDKSSSFDKSMTLPCDPLPIADGYRFIKTEGGVQLRLPFYADIRRRRDKSCEYISSLFFDYLWYKDELIPEGPNRFKIEKDPMTVKVFLSVDKGGLIDVSRKKYNQSEKPRWRYEDPIPHKRFPLQYYPKLFWNNPDGHSYKTYDKERLDSIWGVTNTKYKDIITDLNFGASCGIPPSDKLNLSSRVESDFVRTGAHACRGYVKAGKGNRYLGAMIDVNPYYGLAEQESLIQINQIYDAVVEELQSFIQE